MKIIAASILGKDNKHKIVNMLINKGIHSVHYDVMDGKFVKNKSLPVSEIKKIISATEPHYKDVHLMVQNPEKYIEKLIGVVDQVSIHVESKYITSLEEVISKYSSKIKIGIAVNPDTKLNVIKKYVKNINHVMIMSVVPGKGGQTFIKSSMKKIKKLLSYKKKFNNDLIIEIDGGINNIWGPKVFDKGVDIVVSGSYLINNINEYSIEQIHGIK